MADNEAEICPKQSIQWLAPSVVHMVMTRNSAPVNEAEVSPFLSRSKSPCSEFVCRTPRVYSEFMAVLVRTTFAMLNTFSMLHHLHLLCHIYVAPDRG